jgi:hypothetical protein
MVLCARDAGAYQTKQTATGMPLRWPAGSINVEIALDQGPATPGVDDSVAAAQRAVDTYVTALGGMTSDIQVQVDMRYGSPPPTDGGDGKTTVRWQDDGWDDLDPQALAVTLTSYDPSSGHITDADIIMNTRYSWCTSSDGCRGEYDVQSILTHEVGHVFGLAHDTDPDAVMYPTAAACETRKRKLAHSDLEGLSFLYAGGVDPADPPPASCAVGRRSTPDAAWILLSFGLWSLAHATFRGWRHLAARWSRRLRSPSA